MMHKSVNLRCKTLDTQHLFLRCPRCYAQLLDNRYDRRPPALFCETCQQAFPLVNKVPDFRIDITNPNIMQRWKNTQKIYEETIRHYDFEQAITDDHANAEIYKWCPLNGRILDIGGGHGFLRKYLHTGCEYFCIDPWPEVQEHAFELAQYPNVLSLYPFLREPYYFVIGFGERLPFPSDFFNWVHIRSVLDHTADPLAVIRESWRVLRANGALLVNITVTDGPPVFKSKRPALWRRAYRRLRKEGLWRFLRKALATLVHKDIDHMFHPSSSEIISLVEGTGFSIDRSMWLSDHTGIVGDFLLISRK